MTKHEQITQYIQQQCLNSSNAKLPSEFTLAKHFLCSRATVANALHGLAKNGFIYSRPGSGWYIVKNSQSAFIKSVSQTIDFDDKKITIITNPDFIIDSRFKKHIDHFLKIEYLNKNKVVALLFLMVKKWEIIHLNLAKLKISTNNLYENKIIQSIEYEILISENKILPNLGSYVHLNAPVVKFSVVGNEDNLISIGYIWEQKSNFNFKIKRSWI